MKRYAFVAGRLREVRACWVWLFELLHIGMELPEHDKALREVVEAMEAYNRKCQVYLRG